ncbi:ATP-binding cassette domain-containing protein [Lacticaseibacillus sp. GG6-2]
MAELLTIQGLVYRRNLHTLLNGIDLTLSRDRIVGLLGANGAGKTTLMRLIAGLAGNYRGAISMADNTTNTERKAHVSFTNALVAADKRQRVAQLANFWEALYPDFDRKRFDALAATLDLPQDKRLMALSKGIRMKVEVALTLARNVDLYLLDEPFDGIDSMTRKKIITSIITWKPDGATILISDHHVTDVANLLDTVVVLKDQRVVDVALTDAIREQKHETIEDYYEHFYEGSEQDD